LFALLFCISNISLENTKLAVCMCIYNPHFRPHTGCIYIYIYIHIYIFIYIYVYVIERENARECARTGTEGGTLCCGGIHVYTFIYICIDIEREREREGERESARAQAQRAAHSAAGTCRALIEPS
jgi:hypothetical protein